MGLLLALVGILPSMGALFDSFFRDVYGDRSFAGLSNYRFLFNDSGFALSALITLAWAAASAAISLLVGFTLATFLHESKRAFRVLYLALLVPWAAPAFISIPIWRMLFHGAGGDSVISALFGIRVNLLTDPLASFLAALFVNGWMNAPASVFVIYGALRSVPKSLAEAASLEGANGARISFSVLLPQARASLFAIGALEFMKAFKEFNLPYLFTMGGPPLISGITRRTIVGAMSTLEIYLYELFRDSENYGLAAAYASVLAISTGVLAALAFSLKRRGARPEEGGKRLGRHGDSLLSLPSRFIDNGFADLAWKSFRALLALVSMLSSLLAVYAVLWAAFSGLSANYIDSIVPKYITLKNFVDVFAEDGLTKTFINTLFVSLAAALMMPFIAFPAALALRKAGRGIRARVFGLVQASSAVGGMHSLIPLYAIARAAGLLDSYLPIVVVYLFHATPFALFTTSAYLTRIPRALEEAAEIDGAGPIRKFFLILLPLALPAAATGAMIAFLAAWNGFLVPLLFLNDDAKYTIGVRLASYVGSIASGSPRWNRFAAASFSNLVIVALLLFQVRKPLGDSAIAEHDE